MGGSPMLTALTHSAATPLAPPSPELAEASSKEGGGVAILPFSSLSTLFFLSSYPLVAAGLI